MKIRNIVLTLSFILLSTVINAQTKVIAHRGYWKTDGSAQNSITSLSKADSIGCFGSECDVWITKDGKVMVNHDESYKNVVLETATYKEVKNLTLKNGEKMPTLQSYLKKAKKLQVQLIIEIKTHQDINRQNAAIDATLRLVKKAKLENRVTYIAFSLDAVKKLIKDVPSGTEVYYLNGELSPKQLKEIGCSGPDYEDVVFKSHPEWIAESHQLGLKTNVWTVNEAGDMTFFINKAIDYITTNEPILLQQLVNGKSK